MSQTASVISVKVSNEEQSYTHKFNVYSSPLNPIVLSQDDATLKGFVDQTLAELKGVATDVSLTIKLSW